MMLRRFQCREERAAVCVVIAAGLFVAAMPGAVFAQVKAVGGLDAVPRTALSDPNVSGLGETAFAVRPDSWQHAESQNFVYHFFENFIATAVSVEAEYYYKLIARELRKDTSRWERKSHIFVFDRREDWAEFKRGGELDPWTGGLHLDNELYVLRDSAVKWKGRTLGHEVSHLVIHRFFGNGIPLWLNEGYAEYSSIRAYSSYFRARGYSAKPWSHTLEPERLMPLQQLLDIRTYPQNPALTSAFYVQSEKLVRFLSVADGEAFLRFMDDMSAGAYFQTALQRHYSSRWSGFERFEEAFGEFAVGDRSATDTLREAD